MAFFDWGNRPVNNIQSTSLLVANPSTSTLIAELDSTRLHTGLYLPQSDTSAQRDFLVNWYVGASTLATWQLEQCKSTANDMATSGRWNMMAFTGTNQSAQFQTKLTLTNGDRLRVRLNSSFTGNACAQISAEPLT